MTRSEARRPLRVLTVGPGPASEVSRGGMATVMTEMLRLGQSSRSEVRLSVVVTHLDHGLVRKRLVGLAGMVRAALRVASGRADVLHVHLAHRGSVFRKSAPILAARLRGIPVVMHAHSYNFAAWYRATSPRVQSLTRHVLRADRWLVLGNDLADEYTEVLALDPDRVEVLHNPAPKPHVVTPDPEAPILGLALGRLGERKGTFDVIAAIRSLNPATRAQAERYTVDGVVACRPTIASTASTTVPARVSVARRCRRRSRVRRCSSDTNGRALMSTPVARRGHRPRRPDRHRAGR